MTSSLRRSAARCGLAWLMASCAPHPAAPPPPPPASPRAEVPAESGSASAPAVAAATDPPSPSVAPSADAGPPDAARVDTVGEAMALQARLTLVDAVVGTGREAKEGDHVSIHCVGTLGDGTVFDSTRARKKPLQLVAGASDAEGAVRKVVVGLAEGIVGMKVGGKRTLTVPPALGYGNQGLGKKVPAGATLTYDVELLSVR